MCWNFETSLFTGIFSYATALIIYNRDYGYDRWLALFILSLSTIQWLEAILWKNINDHSSINHYITKYAIPFVLASEGMVALYGAGLYTSISYEMYVTYFIFALLIFLSCMESYNHTTVATDGHLKWYGKGSNDFVNIVQGIVFLLFVATPFWLYMNNDNLTKFVVLAGIVATYIYSVIVYKETWQSNWCLFGNAINVFILARPYL